MVLHAMDQSYQKVTDLQEKNVDVPDWPENSPNLNPKPTVAV